MIHEMKILENKTKDQGFKKYKIIGHNLLFIKYDSVNTEASLAKIQNYKYLF